MPWSSFSSVSKCSKNIALAITELYSNLSYRTLSGARDFSFDSVSDLTSGINFKIKKATLSNRDKKEEEDEISLEKISENTTFVELPRQFEQNLIDDLFNDLEYKKTEHPYVEPQVQDAATIETETKNTNVEFFGLQQMFNEVNDAAREQKQTKKRQKQKQNEVITLFDDILEEDNPFNNIKTDNIYIEDHLFDNNDSQDIKNISRDVTETIDLSDDIEFASDNELVHDAQRKINIITHPDRTRLESCRILKKYQTQQQKDNLKKIKK